MTLAFGGGDITWSSMPPPHLLVFDEGREHEMFVGKKETISPYLTPSLPTAL